MNKRLSTMFDVLFYIVLILIAVQVLLGCWRDGMSIR